jgi:hypothetical protein
VPTIGKIIGALKSLGRAKAKTPKNAIDAATSPDGNPSSLLSGDRTARIIGTHPVMGSAQIQIPYNATDHVTYIQVIDPV